MKTAPQNQYVTLRVLPETHDLVIEAKRVLARRNGYEPKIGEVVRMALELLIKSDAPHSA